jgi:hypothetical protein
VSASSAIVVDLATEKVNVYLTEAHIDQLANGQTVEVSVEITTPIVGGELDQPASVVNIGKG